MNEKPTCAFSCTIFIIVSTLHCFALHTTTTTSTRFYNHTLDSIANKIIFIDTSNVYRPYSHTEKLRVYFGCILFA